MARTVPSTVYHSPGDLVTASTWNAGPKAINDFFSNRPCIQASDNAIQSVANNAWTPVNYGIDYIDTDNGHSVASNTQMFFAEVQGWYWVRASFSWNPSGVTNIASRIDTAIAKNGTIVAGSAQFLDKGNQINSAQSASVMLQLNVGDRAELWVRQFTGATQNSDTGTVGINSGMTVLWVRS